MARSQLEKLRIPLSRIYCIIIVALVCVFHPGLGLWMELIFFSIGLILVAIGSIGRLWCMLYISGHKTKTLITTGPYSLCRNPLYCFSFIGTIGLGFSAESLVVTLLLTIPMLFLYPFLFYLW